MRRLLLLLAIASILWSCERSKGGAAETPQRAPSSGMAISSPAFKDNSSIPAKFTCDGSDVSPPLVFSGVPSRATSLALVVDDPDAPGGTFDHWVMWDIPSNIVSVAEGQPPQGVSGMNGFGKEGYGGPCPPGGEHRYLFKLYALDTMLKLPPTSHKADVEKAMSGHAIAEARITGKYARAK